MYDESSPKSKAGASWNGRPKQTHQPSYLSTTSTEMSATVSGTGTSTSVGSTSTSTLPSSAPTPYNTFISPGNGDDDYGAGGGNFASSSRSTGFNGSQSQSQSGMEYLYEGGGVGVISGPDGSLGLSSGPTPTPTSSRHPSSLSSRAGSSHHLLPYTPPKRDPQIQSFMIPRSDKPVPLPPQTLSYEYSPYSNGQSPLATPSDDKSFSASSAQVFSGVSRQVTPPAEMDHTRSADAAGPWSSRLFRRKGRRGSGKNSAAEIQADQKAQEDRDALRLQQLGYDAVLGRDYTFWSSLAISWLNIGCIQGTVYAVSGAYSFGGPLMILVMWPLSGCWTIFLTLSLAELASVYPVSGAMASWAWKVARGGVGWERWWAWLMGGVVLGGHVASALLVTWQLVNIIHGIMGLSFDYQYQAWHGILFFLTVLLVCGVIGSQPWGRSHRFWICAGLYGALVWLILCLSLLSSGARHSYSVSPSLFFNKTGWDSRPYVFILGWEYCTIASGHDASAHMAEETQNPSRNVPNAMVSAMALTYICGMISISLLLLSIDPNDARTISEHTFAVGYILTQAINQQAAIGICCLLIFTLTVQIMAQLQASSRFVFAMARDNAFPFAEHIRKTNAARQPIVAHWLVIALCAPFSLLVLAGKGPLYSVLAVTASTLSYFGYTTPVLLYLLSGKDLRTEGRSSWSLRTKSRIIAGVGVTYGIAVIALSMAPGSYPVMIRNISWSPVILVGTILVCFITWKFYGIKHYSGPIKAVTKWETGVEIDLQSALTTQRSKPSGPASGGSKGGFTELEDLEPSGARQNQSGMNGLAAREATDSSGPAVRLESVETGLSDTGAGTEWTDATASGATGDTEGTGSTFTRDTVSRMGVGQGDLRSFGSVDISGQESRR